MVSFNACDRTTPAVAMLEVWHDFITLVFILLYNYVQQKPVYDFIYVICLCYHGVTKCMGADQSAFFLFCSDFNPFTTSHFASLLSQKN